MAFRLAWIWAAAQPQYSEKHVGHNGTREREHCQHHQSALQQRIKREMEEIEPDIDPEKRIGHSERAAVTKAQVSIPLRLETQRKEQGDDGTAGDGRQLEKPGGKTDTDLSEGISSVEKGGRPYRTDPAEIGAVSDRLTEIDPQVQKGEDEGREKHRPLDRQKSPKDAGVVELPHPQPFH